jgi:hypothetical protein
MAGQTYAIVEVLEKATEAGAGWLKAIKVIAGSEAYRKYNWLLNRPGRNVAGNFRGMVVSGRWAAVFHFSEDLLKPVERFAVLGALVANILQAGPHIHAILSSPEEWPAKGARLAAEVSSISSRTALGFVPASAHIIAWSLGGYLEGADLAGLHDAQSWNHALHAVDTKVSATFETVTDGNNIYFVVNHVAIGSH